MQTRILAILEDGPLHKWELRDRLGFNEARVYRELLTLRAAGQVKVIGKKLDQRKWALRAYVVPTETAGPTRDIPEKPILEAPGVSWWIEAQVGPRSHFYEVADSRDRVMASSYSWRNKKTGVFP